MTTSFKVPPVTSLRRLRFASDAEHMANRRWGEIALFHGVGGADDTGKLTDSRRSCVGSAIFVNAPTPSRARPATSLTLLIPAALATSRRRPSPSRTPLTGLVTRCIVARCNISAWLGGSSPVHGFDLYPHSASGVRSVNIRSMITPEAPSIVAWWVFCSSAHRPSARPSIT